MIGNAVPVRLSSYMAKAISLCLAKSVEGADSSIAEPTVDYQDTFYLSDNIWI